jgi:nucleoside phosphorylase
MSLVFVFTATRMEGRRVERLMRAKVQPSNSKAGTRGVIGDNQVLLVNTGMGPYNAQAVARRVLRPPGISPKESLDTPPIPDAAIITGLAGSLVPWIDESDIVIYQNCLSATRKEDSVCCSPEIVEVMTRSLELQGLKSKSVVGISSPQIAQSDRDRQRLAETGAAVVDMESFEVAGCLAAAGVPVAVIRAVSDSPGSHMPDLNRALNPAGEFNRWALAVALASSPLATARLFKASRRAIAALDLALLAVLSKGPIGSVPVDLQARHSLGLSQIQR